MRSLFIELGLNILTQDLVLACMANDHDRARKLTKGRSEEGGYKRFRVFAFNEQFGDRLFAWLCDQGIPTNESRSLVRQMGEQLLGMIDQGKEPTDGEAAEA